MNEQLEEIRFALRSPLTIRYEEHQDVLYFYSEFKHHESPERYLIVVVIDNSLDYSTFFGIIYHGNSVQICATIIRIHDKYLNGNGFVITSFFTNKITGQIWKTK
ncbi:hypothetical protein J4447_04735 [Candidatus Pacearchaeota archaeon]|nr:hypothetical protein [Candidatus Pacearchaeota archaeon]